MKNSTTCAQRTPPRDQLRLPDGRLLGFTEYGKSDGIPLFAFHGTPGSRFMFRLADEQSKRLGLRVIAPERPGFGLSSFQSDRRLKDWPFDVSSLANALHIDRFAVAGVSGGGPYAVACAALLKNRVMATALVSPMGPVSSSEGPSRIGTASHLTFRLAHKATPAMHAVFHIGRAMFLNTPNSVYRFLQARASPSDAKILAREDVKQNLLLGVAEGVRPGVQGFVQEMRIFGAPWDIPFSDIQTPVFLWQGMEDRNVPPAASLHLAKLIPHCRVFVDEKAGHYWIFDHLQEVLDTLRKAIH